MSRLIKAATAALCLSTAPGVFAAVSEAEWEQFKAKFAEMEARMQALEAENAQLKQSRTVPVEDLSRLQEDVAALKVENAQSSWADRLSVKGDFRYRYETIDVQHADNRDRNRIRARVNMTAALPDDVVVGFGLATGDGDPVSTNQTLGKGNSSKQINLDTAFFTWNATQQFALTAGKYVNPLYRPGGSELFWDSDWRPEGVSAVWKGDNLFANFLGNWLESDTASAIGSDKFAWGVQGGATLALGEAGLTAVVGYYDFPSKGAKPFYGDRFYGNTSVDGVYLYDYDVVELGANVALSLFDMPLSLYGDYAYNTDGGQYDTGWYTGATLGKTDGWGTWAMSYVYQDLEANAVLGLLSDSDFAGGGTDGKGSRIKGDLGINKQWTVGFTWFVDNKYGMVNLEDAGGAREYNRVQLDTQFKY